MLIFLSYYWYNNRIHFTDLGVLVKVLKNLKAPVLVLLVFGKPVQVEETLYCLWSQEVVSVCKLSKTVEKHTIFMSNIAKKFVDFSAFLTENVLHLSNQDYLKKQKK